ncbi:hypothetical protein IGB42_03327 [Andreprevotia sp. IGB-42]|nr:hypothetical protein IGB42_03327 [Andreprevotia sp. IGB-42]
MRIAAGFTLLELLVVLALLGLLMGLVAPNFVGQLERSGRRFALDQFQAQLSQLPRWARLSGEVMVLEKLDAPKLNQGEEILSLPAGWHAAFTPPLRISPSQICSSSSIAVTDDHAQLAASYKITAPACTPVDEDQ